MKSVTIKDISRIAGVSTMTVSRVVNREKHVKRETREKVIRAIKQYGYEPNYFARSLKTRRSKTIGLIIGDIENPYYSRLSKGVIDTAEDADYNVMVCNSKYSSKLGEKYLNMLLKRGVDGLVIATIDFDAVLLEKISRKNVPFVLVTRRLDAPEDINYVIADDYYGGRLAAEYLVRLGHRKILFLRAADVSGANERVRAFKDILRENSISLDGCMISRVLTGSDEIFEETKRLLKNGMDLTAVIAGNDFVAIEAMEAMVELGLDIPGNISLIGYDNLKITSILKVPLTTVDQPKLLFGQLSAMRLIRLIEDPEARKNPQKIIKRPKLVIRDSCRKIGGV